jgi:hypothetical protein
MPRLLEVVAGGRVFDEGTIYLVVTMFGRAHLSQHPGVLVMESPFDRVIFARIE